MIKVVAALILAMMVASLARADQPTELEQLYLDQLQSWLDEGGDPMTAQERVLAPCSKLVILSATVAERTSFLVRQEMDEYDFRASFCMQATVNQVHRQPEFQNSAMIEMICAEPIRSIQLVLVCAHYQLK
jgi:hypothetical protein